MGKPNRDELLNVKRRLYSLLLQYDNAEEIPGYDLNLMYELSKDGQIQEFLDKVLLSKKEGGE